MRTVGMGVKPKISKKDADLVKVNKELADKVAALEKENAELTAASKELADKVAGK